MNSAAQSVTPYSISLPDEYDQLTDDGTAVIDRQSDGSLVVALYIHHGLVDRPAEAYVYAPSGLEEGQALLNECVHAVWPQGSAWYRAQIVDYPQLGSDCR